MLPLPRKSLLSAVLTALVVSVLVSAPTSAADTDTPSDDGASATLDEATDVLQPGPTTQLLRRAAPAAFRTEGTLALRELALIQDELDPSELRRARGLLARPTDGASDQFGNGYDVPEATPICSDVVCVHYTTTGSQSVSAVDRNSDGVPDYAQTVLDTVSDVHRTYVAAGYRAPKSDGTRGGNGLTDVYLADIGRRGLYGYCTSDEPAATLNRKPWDTWAYCVLDNNFSSRKFPKNTPLQNLRVTAAHEYFHAVQFGYDVSEDPWLLEGTAVWAEDELFDDVNDSVQYLPTSPMKLPQQSLDSADGNFPYGTWSFFRFLTERYRARTGPLPNLILDIWKQADGSAGAPDKYSLEAVKAALRQRRTTMDLQFARYAAANRQPAYYYNEARARRYPHSKLAGKTWLRQRKRRSPLFTTRLDHLTSATYRIRPAKNLRARNWKLNLTFNMADKRRGSVALIRIRKTSGHRGTKLVRLNARGNGFKQVPFSRAKVKWVEVTLVNASDRFRCFRRSQYSCEGESLDDFLRQKVRGRAVRR